MVRPALSGEVKALKVLVGLDRLSIVETLELLGEEPITDYYDEEAADTGLLNDKTSFMRGSG